VSKIKEKDENVLKQQKIPKSAKWDELEKIARFETLKYF